MPTAGHARAQIFCERAGDKGVEVETGQGERVKQGVCHGLPHSALMNKARDNIAIGPADFDFGTRLQHQKAFAIGVRAHLADLIKIDDF